jgi:hypothetical protein
LIAPLCGSAAKRSQGSDVFQSIALLDSILFRLNTNYAASRREERPWLLVTALSHRSGHALKTYHVKSMVIEEGHALYGAIAAALAGYRSGKVRVRLAGGSDAECGHGRTQVAGVNKDAGIWTIRRRAARSRSRR